MKLEKDPENEAGVNEVFRAIHTLKGSSALFDAQPLTSLVHAGEDVLSAVRSGALRLSPDIADHILDMLDQAGVWLDRRAGIGSTILRATRRTSLTPSITTPTDRAK